MNQPLTTIVTYFCYLLLSLIVVSPKILSVLFSGAWRVAFQPEEDTLSVSTRFHRGQGRGPVL